MTTVGRKNVLLAGGLFLLTLFGAICATAQVNSPQREARSPGLVYRALLDEVFPRLSENHNVSYSLVLRFTPSFGPESQISIVKRTNGRLDLTIYKLSKDEKPISQHVQELMDAKSPVDAHEYATRIRIEKQTFDNPSRKLRSLVARFSELRLSPKLDTRVTLDGVGYDCWFEASSNSVHFSLVGSEPGRDQHDYPLIRWMNSIRQAAEAEKSSADAPR